MTSITIILILIIGYFFSNSPHHLSNNNRRNFIITISVILILQSGLRNLAVGPDTYAYKIWFEEINDYWNWDRIFNNFKYVYLENEGKDAGFIFLIKIFQLLSDSYRLFLFFIAIIFFSSFGLIVYKNTSSIENIIFSYTLYLALFYAFFSITGHRQTIATSIVLFGFNYVKNKKLIKFLVVCFIAFFIHKSSIIFLLIYPLYWSKNTFKIYSVSVFLLIIVFLFRRQIIDYTYILYYSDLLEIKKDSMPFTFIFLMMACFLYIYRYIYFNFKNSYYNVTIFRMSNIIIIAFILAPTIGNDSGTMRIVQYFSLFLTILIPSIFDAKVKYRKILYITSIILLLFLSATKNQEYSFYWQEMELGNNYGVKKIIKE